MCTYLDKSSLSMGGSLGLPMALQRKWSMSCIHHLQANNAQLACEVDDRTHSASVFEIAVIS